MCRGTRCKGVRLRSSLGGHEREMAARTWDHQTLTVIRFRKGIETSRLAKVQVTPEDLTAINKGMTTCSNYTGHDGSMVANLPTPSPEEMSKHLDELEAWRKLVDDRLNSRQRSQPQGPR